MLVPWKSQFFTVVAVCLLGFSAQDGFAEQDMDIEIVLDKPTFVLPRFTGAYQEREASIAPSEYETADRLQKLLESGQEQQVLDELKNLYDIEMSPAMLSLKAQLYFSLGKLDEAEKNYLAVLRRMPQLIRVHSDLGKLYFAKEDFDKARMYFSNAVNYGATDASVYGQLAYLNLLKFGPFSALEGFKKAFFLEPTNPQWQQGLLAALMKAKLYNAADALIQDLTVQYPQEARLWLNRAAIAIQRDDVNLALQSMEIALLLGEKDSKNVQSTAFLHLQLGSYDRAINLLDRLAQSNDLNISTMDEAVQWLVQNRLYDKAEQFLNRVLSGNKEMSDVDRSKVMLHKAIFAEHRQDYKAAESAYRKALELDPLSGKVLLRLADYLLTNEKFSEAEMFYVRAESLSGFEKSALFGRSRLYIVKKDYVSALKVLLNLRLKFPDTIEIEKNIEILEHIVQVER